jgi:hypothetical protein
MTHLTLEKIQQNINIAKLLNFNPLHLEVIIAALEQAEKIAKGELVLVPREATVEMLLAAQDAWIKDNLKRSTTLYNAMIAAAQPPRKD